MLEKGLVQIYTGHGKGKTTAAFGLAFRASGDDNKVLIYQFLKSESLDLSERRAAKKCGLDITVEALPVEWSMIKSLKDEHVRKQTAQIIKQALDKIIDLAAKKCYNVIILDELVFCVSQKLAEVADIKRLIDSRDPAVEIVMTGRDASDELIELADLVSEITPIKHPYEKGIAARKGIEY